VGSIVAGLAVTYLAAPANPNIAGGRGPVDESAQVTLDVAVALLFLLVGGVALYAVFAPRGNRFTGAAPSILALFLVSLSFLLIVHLLVPVQSITVPVNQTNTSGPPLQLFPNASSKNETFGPLPVNDVPGWAAYALLGFVAVVALLLLAPLLRARGAEPPAAEEREAAAVRRTLETALSALAREDPKEARQIVIALYARLLETLGPYLDNLASATPREIEIVAVSRFGIAPAPAAQLTRLFEEARYSTHPFTDLQAERARSALAAALEQVKVRSYHGGA
jgi:hypothetical protein